MAGTYILTDTINRAFGEVFASSYKNKAVVVTPKQALGRGTGAQAAEMNEATLARVRTVPGVAAAAGDISSQATLFTTSGKRLNSGASPTLVFALQPPRFESFTAAKGHLPRTADELAIDQSTAARQHLRARPANRGRGQGARADLHDRRDREVRGQRIVRRRQRRPADPSAGAVHRQQAGAVRQHQRRRQPGCLARRSSPRAYAPRCPAR